MPAGPGGLGWPTAKMSAPSPMSASAGHGARFLTATMAENAAPSHASPTSA